MRPFPPLLALATLLATAACTDPPPADNVASAQVPAASVGGVSAGQSPAPGVPVTEPEPVPELQPMRYDEFAEMKLLGAGCTFHTAAGGPPILLLRDEGDGLVKYKRGLRRITAPTPDHDAIVAGGIASGDGVTFTINHAPVEGRASGDSTLDWDADLLMRMSDGGERRYADGLWRCGS